MNLSRLAPGNRLSIIARISPSPVDVQVVAEDEEIVWSPTIPNYLIIINGRQEILADDT
jgi:hypothetical protein